MFHSGLADEAGNSIEEQILATRELGWGHVELRNVNGVNITDLPEADFDHVCRCLDDAGIRVNAFGSTVANWAKDPASEPDFQQCLEELQGAIPRMKRLGVSHLRGMSFKVPAGAWPYPPELEEVLFEKVRRMVGICAADGILYLHENCMNYGGLSALHTLRLVEAVNSAAFGLVFDTANPLHARDRSGNAPTGAFQRPWEFYQAVRPWIQHVHIKDYRILPDDGSSFYGTGEYCWPGEGDAEIPKIVGDLLATGYDAGFTIEPHMAVVYHDADAGSAGHDRHQTYVEYGGRWMALLDSVQSGGPMPSVHPPVAPAGVPGA